MTDGALFEERVLKHLGDGREVLKRYFAVVVACESPSEVKHEVHSNGTCHARALVY